LNEKAKKFDVIKIQQRVFPDFKFSLADFVFGQLNEIKMKITKFAQETPQIWARL